MSELTKIDKRFCVNFLAVAMLHVTREVSRYGFGDRRVDGYFINNTGK